MICTERCGIDHYKQDCLTVNSAGYRSAYNNADVDLNDESDVATTLSLVTATVSNQATTSNDTGGWQTVCGSHRGAGKIYRGGYNRVGYGGYDRGGRGLHYEQLSKGDD
ncbi:hypothetical protein B0H13DRAFT_1927595 [Mycena leptocephala]|nr:hypothetical protein B0H13DRAFT_1927595 [Mycena leptocephala]